jgi:predicted nucleotidyltransferase
MSDLESFDPAAILEVLIRHDVRFVLIGGVAAQALGSPSITGDVDICYARDHDNLDRLADALVDLAAVRRGLPTDAPRMPPLDTRTLRAGGLFTLTTRYGDFDILATPDPGLDYQQLVERATTVRVHGASIPVASLTDLMEMKRAAGRPKDRIELEILGALREELDRRD